MIFIFDFTVGPSLPNFSIIRAVVFRFGQILRGGKVSSIIVLNNQEKSLKFSANFWIIEAQILEG
jgi:hypothetical protein